ncbi:MAG: hypothetical protein AAB691_04575 [Patescibacteria group bacterium]
MNSGQKRTLVVLGVILIALVVIFFSYDFSKRFLPGNQKEEVREPLTAEEIDGILRDLAPSRNVTSASQPIPTKEEQKILDSLAPPPAKVSAGTTQRGSYQYAPPPAPPPETQALLDSLSPAAR